MKPRLGIVAVGPLALYDGPTVGASVVGWLVSGDVLVLVDSLENLPAVGWKDSTRRVLVPVHGMCWSLGDSLRDRVEIVEDGG